MKLPKMFFCFLIAWSFFACSSDDSITLPTPPITAGNDPNFKIVANDEGVLTSLTQKVEVFGVKLFAAPQVTAANLLHAANLMAQYLDNDEDGVVDNQAVVDKMVEKNAFMILWKTETDFPNSQPSGWEGQDLGNDETIPSFVANGKIGQFDAALEEVLHLITHVGFAGVYPDVFGERVGTELGNAMDIARGGQFTSIPNPYPNKAWYTYDDQTCDYSCMATEYLYWSLSSILGAQENRLSEIQQEWKLNTSDKVRNQDQAIYSLLTDPKYKFPTVLPDGTYMH